MHWNWNIVTIVGIYSFSGLTRVSSYKFENPFEYEYNQQHQQTSHHIEHEEHKNNQYSSSNTEHQNHLHNPEDTDKNQVSYEYKEFIYPHEEPPKHLVAVEPQTDYSWLYKLGLIAIGKFIIKIIIIKKILKFFAVIFFLFFVPGFFTAVAKNLVFDEFGRKLNIKKFNNRGMENLTTFILTSIDGFQNTRKCKNPKEEWSCRLNGMFEKVDSKYPLKRLLKYFKRKSGFDITKFNPKLKPTKLEYS